MLTTIAYDLTFLDSTQTEAVLHICNQQLGSGFLSLQQLQQYINNTNQFCHLAWYQQEVVGFSFMEIGDYTMIADKMKSGKDWFLEYFAPYNNIGYRSLTAVKKGFEGRGIASFLVKQGLDFLATKVEVVVCDAWKSNKTHIGSILERHAYHALKEIPHFWTADSIQEQYSCGVCGAPPCECTAVIYAKFFQKKGQLWWEREDLNYQHNTLHFCKTNLVDFMKNKSTPLYIYNADRVVEKYQQVASVWNDFEQQVSIYYAMKANRHPAILNHLRIRTNAGIDVCSPNELQTAIEHGFKETQITYTGTSVSNQDLQVLAKHPNIKINFDSLSAIRRFQQFSDARDIGIRINTNIGMAYNQDLEYTGNEIVKFGIYKAQWADLKRLIDASPFTITTVHCHAGSGFLSNQLQRLPYIFDVIDEFIQLFPTVTRLNLGGGLGVPQKQGDQLLDLKQWSNIIAAYAAIKGLNLAFEPGDFLVKDAGILITEVNTIEQKIDKHFVGINAGMNMNYEYAYYQMNLEPVLLQRRPNEGLMKGTIAGNINEPIDLFAEDKWLPQLQEGDMIALLNSGGYGSSTSSNHCMRGDFKEYILCE